VVSPAGSWLVGAAGTTCSAGLVAAGAGSVGTGRAGASTGGSVLPSWSGNSACSPVIRTVGRVLGWAVSRRWWAIIDATATAPHSTAVATPRLAILASWAVFVVGRR
jgi:hypothetical protein